MKRKFRFIFPLLLCSLPLSGCDFISFGDNEETQTVIVDKFYKDYNLTKTGGRLIQELQKMCFEKHTQWVTYGQTWGYFCKTSGHNSADAVSDGSDNIQYLYTGAEKPPKNSSGSYQFTREHVWPCANSAALWTHDKPETGKFSPHYVDDPDYVGGGSDMFHLRPATSSVNTARGNSRFADLSATAAVNITERNGKYPLKVYGAEQTSSGGYQYASKAEPADEMKGDIARIILYVYVHYQERGGTPEGYVTSNGDKYYYSDMTGALSLHGVMGYEDDEACKEVLKAWNKIDPPSEVEKLRNTTVQKIQGNRNPFVDYPNLVDQMFD